MSWYQEHKKAAWISGSAVVAVLLVGGIFYFLPAREAREAREAKEQKQAQQQTGPLRVKVVYPKQGGVERLVRRPATVQSFEYADLYAKVSGYLSLKKLPDKEQQDTEVDIGLHVKKGDVLAEVSAPELFKDVDKAEADLKKAKADVNAEQARLERAKAERIAAEADYRASKTLLRADEAFEKFREKQAKRYADLLASRAIDARLVDEQQDRLQAAIEKVNADQEAVAAAEAHVVAAKARITQGEADVEDAKAAVGVAQAVLDRAQVWAEYTKISSPYTGVVTKRNYHNGDFIREASGGGSKPAPVLAVARTDKMRIIVQVPDRDVPYLKVGEKADLTIDTLPDRHFQGTVARMSYREVYETRTMRTEVDILNPDQLLEDGMYGEMIIHLGREKGVRIPSKCLVGDEKDKERSVYVVRDSRVHEVKVKVGIDDGIEATIRDGLSKSDRVVVERPPGLTDGRRVEVFHDRSEEAVSEKQENKK